MYGYHFVQIFLSSILKKRRKVLFIDYSMTLFKIYTRIRVQIRIRTQKWELDPATLNLDPIRILMKPCSVPVQTLRPLRRVLRIRRSCWGAHWVRAEAAVAWTEGMLRPAKIIPVLKGMAFIHFRTYVLSVRLSALGAYSLRAQVASAYPQCTSKPLRCVLVVGRICWEI